MKTLLLLALALTCTIGQAQTNANSTQSTSVGSTSQSASAIGQGSAIGNTVFNSESTTAKQTPSSFAPNLTTSNDTCMGSSAVGAGAPGFSVSVGSTWVDKNCVRLKNSRELWNMGQRLASLALMCNDPENRDAIEVAHAQDPTAPQCPQTVVSQKQKQQQQTVALFTGYSTAQPHAIASIPDVTYEKKYVKRAANGDPVLE